MSPVADIVIAATGAVGDGGAVEAAAGLTGAALTGSRHCGLGPSLLFANATLPTPMPAKIARTIVIVRTGRPKRPELRDGGWEFIDGDDTFRWHCGRPVKRLVVADRQRR